ncbi:MAG: GGDEF domain-containing phosphodiesterase [Defluviitaleaceae bacterium]|nr:GGDEF domain-containing phosphodiesterase [Defluviitaleaceae bacterium]
MNNECFKNFLSGLDNFELDVFIYNPTDKKILYANKSFTSNNKLNIGDDITEIVAKKHVYVESQNKWFNINSGDITWHGDGEPMPAVFCLSLDIVQNQRATEMQWESVLLQMPGRDSLRLMIDKLLKEEITDYCLVLLNLNFFNKINVSYGYEYGNTILLEIHEFLNKFSAMGSFFVMDGNQFAIIIPEVHMDDFLWQVTERFRDSWVVLEGIEQFINVTMGIIKLDNPKETANSYIQKAASTSKEANFIESNAAYYEEKNTEYIRNEQLEYHLRRAIRYDMESFLVFYQPQVDGKTGKITSFEALSRWVDKEIGFVSPGDFIELAEYLNLINIIDLNVLRIATRFAKKLHDRGYFIKISVNISAKQLHGKDLVENIRKIVEEAYLEYSYVNIEITETSVMADIDEGVRQINALRALGFGIHLDDFGVGHSSLNSLKDIPVTEVKIDRKFIGEMLYIKYSYTFIKSIINLCHSTGLEVCCEGVETREEFLELRKLNCDLMQGYYFSSPLHQDMVMDIIDKDFLTSDET